MKTIISAIVFVVAASVCGPVLAVDGVKHNVVRPVQVDGNVTGTKISKPGKHRVCVGDVIELEYSYPVVPGAIPKKVDHKQTLLGAVKKSPLGFRFLKNGLIGAQTIVFFFDASKKGTETVTLLIDKDEYEFEFVVEQCDE